MCLARVEFIGDQNGQRSGPLSDVARIERIPGGLRVTDLFGSTTELKAEIRTIDFIDSVVGVEDRTTAPGGR